jgi:hypothetical protein
MDAQIDQVKQGDRTPGVHELPVPGEHGERRYRELTGRRFVPLASGVKSAPVSTKGAAPARLGRQSGP